RYNQTATNTLHEHQGGRGSEVDSNGEQRVNHLRPWRKHWIVKEITNILSPVYSYAVKPIIITTFIVVAFAVAWAVAWQYCLPALACNYIPFANYILPFCKADSNTLPQAPLPVQNPPLLVQNPNNPLIKLPSVPTFVEKSTELAERLSNIDVSAPNKLTQVRISLIDLKTQVIYSNIEAPSKQILKNNIEELKTSVESTAERIHKMLAAFTGTLSKLEIYTRYALTSLKDESLIFTTSSSSSSSQSEIATLNFENSIQSQFQHYVEKIENEVERVILLAEDVHSQLYNVETKYETINDVLCESHFKTQNKLDEIEEKKLKEGLFAKLYRTTIGNNNNMDQIKHQRNVETLTLFKDYIKVGIIDVNNIINRLKRFKYEADELKLIVSEIDLGQTMSLNVHIDILQNGIEQLKQSKQRLDGRIKNKQVH
ncbi:unnamed protein product, partial [Didymodactylos carnosus]